MPTRISDDDAALVAHKIVLAHLVAETQDRLGADASGFLDAIRRAARASIQRAEPGAANLDLHDTKRRIIGAIDAIFGVDD